MTRLSLAPRLTRKSSFAIISCYVLAILAIWFIYAGINDSSGLAQFDMPIHEWLVAHRTDTVTIIMQIITDIFGPIVLALVATIGAGFWMWRKKEYWRPALFVVSFGGAFAVSTIIKTIAERARPPYPDMILPLETGYSFPSNHTFGIAVFILLLGYFLYSRRPSRKLFAIWISTFIVGTVVMALTRMYLGYHWLTDVTASIGLAFSILAVVVLVDSYRAWRTKTTKVL